MHRIWSARLQGRIKSTKGTSLASRGPWGTPVLLRPRANSATGPLRGKCPNQAQSSPPMRQAGQSNAPSPPEPGNAPNMPEGGVRPIPRDCTRTHENAHKIHPTIELALITATNGVGTRPTRVLLMTNASLRGGAFLRRDFEHRDHNISWNVRRTTGLRVCIHVSPRR